jgi:hypothetical protein
VYRKGTFLEHPKRVLFETLLIEDLFRVRTRPLLALARFVQGFYNPAKSRWRKERKCLTFFLQHLWTLWRGGRKNCVNN